MSSSIRITNNFTPDGDVDETAIAAAFAGTDIEYTLFDGCVEVAVDNFGPAVRALNTAGVTTDCDQEIADYDAEHAE